VALDLAFSGSECRILADALDKAWEIFLKTGRLTATNIDTARGALAYAIMEAAAVGERNPRRLAIAAVARMAKHEHRIRFERSLHRKIAS
jgi:hypothetical protein